MKDIDKFEISEVIAQINVLIKNKPNHCDYDFLVQLKEELERKLKE